MSVSLSSAVTSPDRSARRRSYSARTYWDSIMFVSRKVPAFEPLSTSTLRFCANSRSSGFRLGVEYCDVVLIVDSKRLHVSSLFPTAYRDDHSHHSGAGTSKAILMAIGKATGGDGAPGADCRRENRPGTPGGTVNRALPAGDRGCGCPIARGASGRGRAVPRARRLVGGVAADRAGRQGQGCNAARSQVALVVTERKPSVQGGP